MVIDSNFTVVMGVEDDKKELRYSMKWTSGSYHWSK